MKTLNRGSFIRVGKRIYRIDSETEFFYNAISYKTEREKNIKISKKTGKVKGEYESYAIPIDNPDEFLENLEKEREEMKLKQLKKSEEKEHLLERLKDYNRNLIIYPVSESEFENLYYCKVYDINKILNLIVFYAHTIEREVLEDNEIVKRKFTEIKPVSFSNVDNYFRFYTPIIGDSMQDCIFKLLK
jgi:hypothetical protein